MYQLVHYSYHNVPLGELVGTLWKIIYQLIHYGNIIAFQNQSYLQIRLEKCLISHQYNITKGILNAYFVVRWGSEIKSNYKFNGNKFALFHSYLVFTRRPPPPAGS